MANDGAWVSTLVSGANAYLVGGEIKLGNVATVGTYQASQDVKYGAGCTAFVGDLIDFQYWRQYLIGLSYKIKNIPAFGTTSNNYGSFVLKGTKAHRMEVFNVKGSELCSANSVELTNVDKFATILINVDGDNLNCGRYQLTGFTSGQTLWNFHTATSLTFEAVSWMGSVLAPFANIHNPTGQISGQTFANSWTTDFATGSCMQQNWVPFTGCISSCYWFPNDKLCTFTEDKWGQDTCTDPIACPAYTALSAQFDACESFGITVGCNSNILYLSSVDAVRAFLPQPATPASGLLDGIYKDVTTTPAGDFAGQLVSLGLSLTMDTCDTAFASACGKLRDVYVCNLDGASACGAFNGLTVGQVNDIANQVIGQCPASGITVDNAYNCVKFINNQFNGCQTWNSAASSNSFNYCQCGQTSCANTPDYLTEAVPPPVDPSGNTYVPTQATSRQMNPTGNSASGNANKGTNQEESSASLLGASILAVLAVAAF